MLPHISLNPSQLHSCVRRQRLPHRLPLSKRWTRLRLWGAPRRQHRRNKRRHVEKEQMSPDTYDRFDRGADKEELREKEKKSPDAYDRFPRGADKEELREKEQTSDHVRSLYPLKHK